MKKLPVTAIVVTCNEADYLQECLQHLNWCDQIIVVDLHSTDDSPNIAKQFTQHVYRHDPSPIVEPVRCFATQHATNDWLIFVDPDEVVPQSLINSIESAIQQPDNGIIRLPWLFHYKRKPLDYTVWGGRHRNKKSMVHRHRSHIRPISQRGNELKPEYKEHTIAGENDNYIRHYWIDNLHQLLEKHIRLGLNEGEGLHNAGLRFSWFKQIAEPLKQLKYCYLTRSGWREGFRGLTLSLVYGLYHTLSWWSLRKYERSLKESLDNPPVHQFDNHTNDRKHAA